MRRLLPGGQRVPAEVRAAVSDRILAVAQGQDGVWLAGTRDALHVVPVAVSDPASDPASDSAPGPASDSAPTTLPWERVLRADWDHETSKLRVEEVRDYGEPVATSTYVLEGAGLLLQLVRERVTASIALQRRVELSGKRGLTVVGRRPPAGGEIGWAFQLDPGVDPDDPGVRAAADAALREAQESLGLR